MTIPDHFPHRVSHSDSVPAPAGPDAVAAGGTAAPQIAQAAPVRRPWPMAALLLSGAAQLITISALVSADPIPASWAALLLAIAPAPVAALVVFGPARAARPSAAVAVVVLVTGIIGQITHTGLFFVPALAAMVVAAIGLWREQQRAAG